MTRRLVLWAVVVGLSAPAIALAGKPFGGDDTGFVPPDRSSLKCENAVTRINAKLNADIIMKCHRKQAHAALAGKPFDEESCEDAAVAKANTIFLKLKGCPPCLEGSGADAARRVEDVLVDGQIYCAGQSPIGGDDSGFIAPDKATLKCEDGFAKNMSRFLAAVFACHARAATAAFRGGAFDDEACEVTADSKFHAANKRLKGCPSCIRRSEDLSRTLVPADLDSSLGSIYCASSE